MDAERERGVPIRHIVTSDYRVGGARLVVSDLADCGLAARPGGGAPVTLKKGLAFNSVPREAPRTNYRSARAARLPRRVA